MNHTVCTIVEERSGEQALYDADGEFVCKGTVFPADYRAVKCTAVTHLFAEFDDLAWDGSIPWPEILDRRWMGSL